MTAHLTPSDLRRLLAGTLTPAEAAHLNGCRQCQAAAERLTALSPEERSTLAAAGPGRHPPVPPVAGYADWHEVGRGGSGVVYRARDVVSGQVVAVKLLRGGALASPSEADWFRREARAAAALDHPHLARVLAVGGEAAVPHYVMEYVPGGSLADALDGTPLSPAVAARLIQTVAGAVHHAHQRGVVHRDLKPGNILLGEGPDPLASPKVSDFGTAKQAAPAAAPTPTLAVLGTPAYMAPEQAFGRSSEVGPAADVYALGAVLYELLTGRPPFRGETPYETLLQVRSLDPVPPRRFRPEVPTDLETVCLKCLEKSPARRYPTAAELAAELDRFLAGRPVLARPVGISGRLRRWARRHPAAAAGWGTAAAVVAVAAGLLVAIALAEAATNRDLAEANRRLDDERTEVTARNAELRRRAYPDGLRRASALLDLGDVDGARRELDAVAPAAGEADLRGFEWHLLARAAAPVPHRVVVQFRRAATAVAYAPDGSRAAAGGEDAEVVVFDPATGREEARLSHPAAVEGVAWSPDGKRLATAGADGVVRVWDAQTWRSAAEVGGHAGRVQAVAWSPDGGRLASGGRDGTVRVWDAAAGTGRRLAAVGESVRAVAWAADGRTLLAGGDASREEATPVPWVLDAVTGRVLGGMTGMYVSVAVGFAAGGRAVTAHRDGTVRVWVPNGRGGWEESVGERIALAHPRIHDAAVGRGGRVVVVCQDGMATVWRLAPPERAAVLRPPGGGRVWAGAVAPDGKQVLTAGADGAVRAWAVAAESDPLAADGLPRVGWLAVAPGGRVAAGGVHGGWRWTVGPDGGLRAEGETRLGLAAGGFDPAGRPIGVDLAGRPGGWDGPAQPPGVNPTVPPPAAVAPNGRWAAAAGPERILVHALPHGPAREIPAPGRPTLLAVGEDGQVAGVLADRTVRVWGPTAWAETDRRAYADRPTAVAVGAGGRVAVAGGGAVHVWGGGAEDLRLVGHRGTVEALDFSPDGRTLAAGGEDRTVRLWRLDTGLEALALNAHRGAITAVRFSPDGRFLAAASRGGQTDYRLQLYDAGDWFRATPHR